jgi:hypothetical protein
MQDLFKFEFDIPSDMTNSEFVDMIIKRARKFFHMQNNNKQRCQLMMSGQENARLEHPTLLKEGVQPDIETDTAMVNIKAMIPFKREHISLKPRDM